MLLLLPASPVVADDGAPPVDIGGGVGGGVGGGAEVVDAPIADVLETGAVSLADVDLYEGELYADPRSIEGDSDVVALAAAGALEIDTAKIAEEARRDALASAKNAAVANCPTSAPSGTLRGGSEQLGIRRLCEESVARASTPQAATAIQYMLANLGVPYSQTQRMSKGWYDCSSYVMRGFQSAGLGVISANGWAPTTHALAPHSGWSSPSWVVTVKPGDVKPGDLLLWVPPERTGHVALQLVGGFMVHTARTGDVSHVQRDNYIGRAHLVRRVVPGRV